MNELKSSFTVLDSYSASTHSTSFQKQYCSFTQYQVTPLLQIARPINSVSKTTLLKE